MGSPSSNLSRPGVFLVVFCSVWLVFLAGRSTAQAPAPEMAPAPAPSLDPTTDPVQATALNSIFSSWGVTPSWNSSDDLCSGSAIDSTSLDDVKSDAVMLIKCNCIFNNMTLCRVTELRATSLPISGEIPEELFNLTSLVKLNIRGNSLSGLIPRELQSLRNLISLKMGMNNFSGSLPAEIGNLINLQEMVLDSLGPGVGGQIPPEFAKLKKLQILWLSDNNFTGTIPPFIGNFTELVDLRLHGNSLQGPIPSSFGNLSKLTQLRIGEVSKAGSSLDFITSMESLTILVLRNNDISGIIPEISLANLKLLDLSFNNLTGQIPESLFILPSIKSLFLGNNRLSGPMPSQKNKTLTDIDLSYNDLSGNIPSWTFDTKLNINLVANNFNLSSDNKSSGLRCLQKNFPCKRSSPSFDFAINCGSTQPVNVLNGPSYEPDGGTLGPATYNVTNNIWAISNVGIFADVFSSNYIQSIGSRFPNSQNSELFQGTRLSPSSLRYYGLGLENGTYSIKLQFGETDNWKPQIGRRFFDIYIQGNRVEKDFNILREAGNTLTAVDKNYIANVTNNFLEIHFFWAGRGTCCSPANGTYGPSISAISVTSSSASGSPQTSPGGANKKQTSLVAAIVVPVVVCIMVVIGIFVWRKKRRQDTLSDDEELLGLTVRPNSFSYYELKIATKDFDNDNKLGQGGFGPVYKGILSDGREVAVKKLSVTSVQGKRQFITEIATISAVQHRNLVKLFGCCYEGSRRLLVYEYLANRSLDQVLFENGRLHLDWQARLKICLGTARGLAYLHEEAAVRIVHRDVKASNILLDIDLNPKVSDFGLAKLHDETKTHVTTGVAGTIGYLAPEYAMRGQLTEKADVFGFGVVAMEIVSGRKNTDPSLGPEKMYLLEWAWRLHEAKCELELMDPKLMSYDQEEAIRVINVAFLCTQASPVRRPPMSRVVAMLVGDMEAPDVLTKPSYLMDWRNTEVSTSLPTGSYTPAELSGTNGKSSAHASTPSSTTQTMLGIDEGR